MKLHIFESTYHDLRCVKALAIIPKSKKLGVPRKFQRTWSMKTVAPQFTIQEMKVGIEAEAKRWEAKVMDKIKREREFSEAVAADRARLGIATPSND